MLKAHAFLPFFLFFACAARVQSEVLQATVIDCKSKIAGPLTLTLSKNKCRIETSKIVVLMKAPDWKVCVTNPDAKTFCITTAQEFVGMGRVRQIHGESMQALPWKLAGKAVLQGLACNKYMYSYTGHDKVSFVAELGRFTDYVRVRSGEYWLAPHYAHAAVETVLAKMAALPLLNGMPVQLDYISEFRSSVHEFKVLKIRTTTVQGVEFDRPSDYKEVKSETEVASDKDTVDGINALMKNIKSGK